MNSKSSVFNMDDKAIIFPLWIAVALISLTRLSPVNLIILFYILLKESKSIILRKHAGQLLALQIFDFIFSLLIGKIFFHSYRWSLLSFGIKGLGNIIASVLGIYVLLCFIYGSYRAIQYKHVRLPLIGELGENMENSFRVK